MKKSIKNYVNACEICQTAKYSRNPHYVPLVLTDIPSKSFEVLYRDIFYFDIKEFLTVVDSFSKFVQVIPIPGKTHVDSCDELMKYVTGYGIP